MLAEREAMFENALAHTRRGVVACVFDTSDRVQHMFYRHMGTADRRAGRRSKTCTGAWTALVGKAMAARWTMVPSLFVLSDHGFCRFRRGGQPEFLAARQRLSGA